MPILKNEHIFDVTDKLTKNVQFIISDVENILGSVGLKKSTHSTEYFDIFKTNCNDSNWLKSVELRMPTIRYPATKHLLLLELKKGNAIKKDQIIHRYGDNYIFEIPSPQEPPESPVHLVYLLSWGHLKFGISKDYEELTDIIIEVH